MKTQYVFPAVIVFCSMCACDGAAEAKWYRQNHMTGKGVPELESALGDEFIVDYVRVYDLAE